MLYTKPITVIPADAGTQKALANARGQSSKVIAKLMSKILYVLTALAPCLHRSLLGPRVRGDDSGWGLSFFIFYIKGAL